MTVEERHHRAARGARRAADPAPLPTPPLPGPTPDPPPDAPPAAPQKLSATDVFALLDNKGRVAAVCTIIAAFFGGVVEVVRIATGH